MSSTTVAFLVSFAALLGTPVLAPVSAWLLARQRSVVQRRSFQLLLGGLAFVATALWLGIATSLYEANAVLLGLAYLAFGVVAISAFRLRPRLLGFFLGAVASLVLLASLLLGTVGALGVVFVVGETVPIHTELTAQELEVLRHLLRQCNHVHRRLRRGSQTATEIRSSVRVRHRPGNIREPFVGAKRSVHAGAQCTSRLTPGPRSRAEPTPRRGKLLMSPAWAKIGAMSWEIPMGLHRVRWPRAWPAFALVIPAFACLAQPAPGDAYAGMAEASAAVALDERHFAVADDECNTLLVYARGQATPVGKPIDLATFLKTKDKASDLEGGAIVGDVVYWISSHSLPRSGKPRAWRQQFFATTVSRSTSAPTLVPHGQPYTGLLDDMIKAPALRDLKLADAAKLLAEQAGGLNIEGLAAWKDGGLLIGFRNPLIAGKAPVVPLKNPAAVVQGGRAQFDPPILLDLAGRGIRSIDRVGDHYLIVAGPVADAGTFALFRWSGSPGEAPALQFELPSGFSPEALVPVAGSKDVDLLSDDGSTQPAAACGSAAKTKQLFRTIRVRLP